MKAANVVVIGAGIGGLSAALALRTQGISTTIVEQYDYLGGKVHQTTVRGQKIDSGPTVFTMRGVFDRLFESAGFTLEELVQLSSADILARHYWRDSDGVDLFTDIDKTCAAITAFSSAKEAQNYRLFASKSEALFHALDDSFMRTKRPNVASMAFRAGPTHLATILKSQPMQTLWNSLCHSFDDPRLRQLFARYSTYCGSSPYKAPATLMLIAHAERAGVWTLNGGMTALANALAKVFMEKGGELQLNSTVVEVSSASHGRKSVVLADGKVLQADAVIFNGDPNAIAAGVLGKSVTGSVKTKRERSLSAVTLATVATTEAKNLSFHNVFFSDHYEAEFDAIFKQQQAPSDPTIYVCAQDRSTNGQSSGDNQADKERIFCLMNAPARLMANDEMKVERHRLLTTLRDHGLSLDFEKDACVYAYPNTFEDRFPHSDGALYGQPTHTSLSSFTRSGSRTKEKGLYLAGGSVHPGAGMPMVSISGQLAAEAVIQDLKL